MLELVRADIRALGPHVLQKQQSAIIDARQPGPEAPGAAEGEQSPSTDGGEDVVDGEFKNA